MAQKKSPRESSVLPPRPSVGSVLGRYRRSCGLTGSVILAAALGGLLLSFLGVSLARFSGPTAASWLITAGTLVTPAPVTLGLPPSLRQGDVPVAVIIENQVAARPAAGLAHARLVVEAPAEGGITRYLAVFTLADLPERIGPVRSVRPYLVDWAEEWQATLFHSGGSPAAMIQLQSAAVAAIDEISASGRYFWRDRKRLRPHNLYTSGRLIRQAFDDLALPRRVVFAPLPSAAESAESVAPLSLGVLIATHDPDYCVAYRYDPAARAYERWLAGERHRSEDGTAVYAKSVLVPVLASRVLDRVGRLRLTLNGDGALTALVAGTTLNGRWERARGHTRYLGSQGEPIAFPDGPVWITVVTDATTVRPLAVDAGTGKDFMLGCGQ